MTEDWRNGGFGLYIHWPFCEAKCPYCDFNSHVSHNIDQIRWKRAYLSEIDRAASELKDRTLNTIFFGGGTPSLMEPDTVAAVIEKIRASWPVANDLEVTLEANPGSVEAGRFANFAQAGVSRISIGVQALNDDDLRRLGRIHSVADARQAIDIAKKNFNRVSFDLIYARQGQGLEDWRKELDDALKMAVDHLSLYQLTIEPSTAFAERRARGGLRDLPDDDLAGDMYELTQDICSARGLEAYEVSNHAKNGSESRHNLIYWRYGDYVGIGPGAHGRITQDGRRFATECWSQPDRWLSEAEQDRTFKSKTKLTPQDQADEYLMMALRLAEGMSARRYKSLCGRDLPDQNIEYLEEIGMVTRDGDRILATRQGRIVLNAVIKELLGD